MVTTAITAQTQINRLPGVLAVTGKFITGFFSITAITPNIISGRKCTGRKWKNFAKASSTCRSKKASAPSSEHTCLVFSIPIFQNVASAPRTSKVLRRQLLVSTRRLASWFRHRAKTGFPWTRPQRNEGKHKENSRWRRHLAALRHKCGRGGGRLGTEILGNNPFAVAPSRA